MYRRQQNGKHQIMVPETLIQEIIRENHSHIFVAHPEIIRITDYFHITILGLACVNPMRIT